MPIICYSRRAQDRPRRNMFTVKPANDDEEFYAAIERIKLAEELIRDAMVTRRQPSLCATQAQCDQLWEDVCAEALDMTYIPTLSRGPED